MFGVRDLGYDVWDLVSGVLYWVFSVWCLVFGVCYLVFGVWCLAFGVWCLVFGVWCLVFGIWCFWSSVFGVWCVGYRVPGPEFSVEVVGFRQTLQGEISSTAGFRDFEFRVVQCKFRVAGYVFWGSRFVFRV